MATQSTHEILAMDCHARKPASSLQESLIYYLSRLLWLTELIFKNLLAGSLTSWGYKYGFSHKLMNHKHGCRTISCTTISDPGFNICKCISYSIKQIKVFEYHQRSEQKRALRWPNYCLSTGGECLFCI